MLRLDHNRAVSQLATRTGKSVNDIEKMIVWGNHSPTMYPDLRFCTVAGQAAPAAVNDEAWYKNEYIPTVGKRGAAIIAARGASSAASAANAAIDHMRDWALGTKGKWVTMGIPSDGLRHPQGHHLRRARHLRERRVQARRRPGHRRLLAHHDGQDPGRAAGRASRRRQPARLMKGGGMKRSATR
jgi:hypothetical protein